MKKFTRAAFAAATTLIASTSAFAADLYGGSIKDDPAPVMTSRPALFYLRGDFTYSSNDFGNMTEAPNFVHTDARIGNSQLWGGGVGYYFSQHVRGDLTLDWSSKASANGTLGLSSGATVHGEREFGVRHLVGLANLYYDFDRGSRFSPYVGVGLGFARNTTTAGTVLVPTCNNACSVDIDGKSKTNAAGAFMAGFTTKLHDRWTLDAGYRFLYVGDAATGDLMIANAVAPDPASTPNVKINDIYSHQFRVGLRMDLR